MNLALLTKICQIQHAQDIDPDDFELHSGIRLSCKTMRGVQCMLAMT